VAAEGGDPEDGSGQALEVHGRAREGHRRMDGEGGGSGVGGGLQDGEPVPTRDVDDDLTFTQGARLHQFGDQRAEGVIADREQQADGLPGHLHRREDGYVGEQRCRTGAGGGGAGRDRDQGVTGVPQGGAEDRADTTGAENADLESAHVGGRGLPVQGRPARVSRGCSHSRSSPCGVPDVPGQRNAAGSSQDSRPALTRSRSVRTVTGAGRDRMGRCLPPARPSTPVATSVS
jgi:hypothetical protein